MTRIVANPANRVLTAVSIQVLSNVAVRAAVGGAPANVPVHFCTFYLGRMDSKVPLTRSGPRIPLPPRNALCVIHF